MAQIINTNLPSLNAQRNLGSTQNSLATSLERLSTGLRINSAKDDAAGLAISERFTTQIRGLNQAVRNANDGISFAQTAEGALGTVSDALQRIRELSIQAANDSNSPSDRQALNNEVQQLIAEVGRVANSTEFNGQKILDGSLEDLFFQVGANQGQTIAVTGVDSRNTSIGATEATSEATGKLTQADIAEGLEFGDTFTITLGTGEVVTVDFGAADPEIKTFEDAISLINREIRDAAADDTDGPAIAAAQLSASVRVDNQGLTSIVINGAFDAEFDADGGDVSIGGAAAVALFDAAAGGEAVPVSLQEVDVTTRNNAFQTIATVDGALTQINTLRAELGAVQVRFESTIANLSISAENLTASRSRIQDADFAAETANLTRAQILQQAGTSVLAQANAIPQNVLNLLG